jgi:hypothetical protein
VPEGLPEKSPLLFVVGARVALLVVLLYCLYLGAFVFLASGRRGSRRRRRDDVRTYAPYDARAAHNRGVHDGAGGGAAVTTAVPSGVEANREL